MNDSLGNKTLCDADTNRLKGNLTPYQYFQKYRPDEWEEVKQRIFKILPYQKAKRFISEKNVDADDFISRQLNDTRYISKQAVAYLKTACENVEITEGSVVSMLRYYWGLDGILSPYYSLNVEDGEYLAQLDENENIREYRHYHPSTRKKDEAALSKNGELLHGQVKNGRFYLIKKREDHRHHAVDAVVTAFATRSYLQKVSTLLAQGLEKKEIKYSKDHQLAMPWEKFRIDVKKAINQLIVYHSQADRVYTKVKKRLYKADGQPKKINGKVLFAEGMAARGPLHEESVFGKHTDQNENVFYHIRKPIDFVQGYKQWRKIVSPRVRDAIYERIKVLYPSEKLIAGELPAEWTIGQLHKEDQKNVFFSTNEDNTRKPMIELSNKNGDPIPVKKVRTKEVITEAPQLKEGLNQYVKSGNNHHCLAYEAIDGKLKFNFVNFWSEVERKKQKQAPYQLPFDGEIIKNVFVKNELFILGLINEDFEFFMKEKRYDQLSQHLYRVQKMSPSGYLVEFRKHSAANLKNKNEWKGFASAKTYIELNPIAVRVDLLGKINAR
jgi:CRISPR-associated endonuclease Csn1